MLTIQIKDILEMSKHIDILKSDIKVMTPNGMKKIYNVGITAYNSDILNIKANKHELMCAPKHLIKSNNVWKKAEDFKINDEVDTKYGTFKVKEISIVEEKDDLIDLQVDGSEYYTNDILSHNSSFQESFDFSIFGIVRGKSQKRIPLKHLPNRINKNTEVEIEFINNFNDKIKLTKFLEPTSATFFENDNDKTKKFKSLSKNEREKIIGFNFETYKSFISMSVSDFANFINLKPEEKRQIVNKLFNLQELDNYLSITKDTIKNNNGLLEKYKITIDTNNETINSYKSNIKNIKKSGIIDKEKEIKVLKKELQSKKEPYIKLKERNTIIINDLKIIQNKFQDFENQKSIITQEILELKMELKNINEKINVYKSGICPTCDTKLNDSKHKHNLKDIENQKNNILSDFKIKNDEKDNLILKTTKLSNQRDSKIKEKNENIVKYNSIIYELKAINKKIIQLKEKEDTISIDEIKKNITELEKQNLQYIGKISKLTENISLYKNLQDIFSTKGIRKTIIKNIVTPLNVYLKDILDELNSKYSVKLDEEFNATIYERMINEVYGETMSVGETKKINIAIALSYLKLILKISKLNILFLDEIFSSMKPSNVELVINILKTFVEKYKINIVIVDPEVYFTENSDLGINYFDRIIKIKQEMNFSTIKDDQKGHQ